MRIKSEHIEVDIYGENWVIGLKVQFCFETLTFDFIGEEFCFEFDEIEGFTVLVLLLEDLQVQEDETFVYCEQWFFHQLKHE